MTENILNDYEENYATGYVKIYRSLKKHWIWSNENYLKWWITILMEVNHAPKKVIIKSTLIDCARGQSVNSLLTWSKEFRTSIQSTRTFLTLLKKDNMILLENVKKSTRLTVCNYATYNDSQHLANTLLTRSQHASNMQLTTNKNVKNYNNDKNNTYMGDGNFKNGELRSTYTKLSETFENKSEVEIFHLLKEFIHTHRPYFPEPYIDAWNIIAAKYGLSIVRNSTHDRQQKIKTRSNEPAFDFFKILESIRRNKNYQGDNSSGWKVDFNYIIASEKNYISIIEKLPA
jgi:hypothetical protein